MASLSIRKLDEETYGRLQKRAARQGDPANASENRIKICGRLADASRVAIGAKVRAGRTRRPY